MPYPPLVYYETEAQYRTHFERVYCKEKIVTFDGIPVKFKKQDFNHAFYESKVVKDDTFSFARAQRIDWIKAALGDPYSEMYVGWDNKKKKNDRHRRVVLVQGNYVVVIGISSKGNGRFITSFLADSGRTVQMIRQNPKWT